MAGADFSGVGEFCGGAGTSGESPADGFGAGNDGEIGVTGTAGGSGEVAKGGGGGMEIKGAGVTGKTG
jgi:hypothetical protein